MKSLSLWSKLAVFAISSISVFGSLYFSEVMELPPCSLCWYQRIFMYPIALISFVDILHGRMFDLHNQFALAAVGWVIAAYHNLLYYNFIENIVPCSQGVSCTSRQIEWLGFITIPLLSLVAFSLISCIIILDFILLKKGRTTHGQPQN